MIANHFLVINRKTAKTPGRALPVQLIAFAQSMVIQ